MYITSGFKWSQLVPFRVIFFLWKKGVPAFDFVNSGILYCKRKMYINSNDVIKGWKALECSALVSQKPEKCNIADGQEGQQSFSTLRQTLFLNVNIKDK